MFGYLLARVNLIKAKTTSTLSKICFNFLIPVYLLSSIATSNFAGQLSTNLFLAFYISILVGFFLVYFYTRYYKHQTSPSAAVLALSGTYSNTVLVSIPILVGLLGQEVAGQAFLIIGLHSALLFTLTELMMQRGSLKSLLGCFKNPLIVGILLGLIINAFKLTFLISVFEQVLHINKFIISFALLTMGASIYFLPANSNFSSAWILTFMKLCVLPLITFMFAKYVFSLPDLSILILVLLTASPTGVNAFFIAQNHNVEPATSASSVVISSIISIFLIPIWIYFLQ